jgi:hypothetical protein
VRNSAVTIQHLRIHQEIPMKVLATTLLCTAMAFSTAATFAQTSSTGSANDATSKDGMMKKDMTTDDCKAHMASMKKDGVMKDSAGNVMNKDGTKRDETMMKQDTMCMDMMNKGSMPADTMKK